MTVEMEDKKCKNLKDIYNKQFKYFKLRDKTNKH